MEKLKLVADYIDERSERCRADEVGDDQRSNGFRQVGGWYLHGKLEFDCGYDLALIVNWRDIPTRKRLDWCTIRNGSAELRSDKVLQSNYLYGVFDVEVEGIDYACVGYFWTGFEEIVHSAKGKFLDWRQYGYVVARDDEEALAFAKEAYAEKRIS